MPSFWFFSGGIYMQIPILQGLKMDALVAKEIAAFY